MSKHLLFSCVMQHIRLSFSPSLHPTHLTISHYTGILSISNNIGVCYPMWMRFHLDSILSCLFHRAWRLFVSCHVSTCVWVTEVIKTVFVTKFQLKYSNLWHHSCRESDYIVYCNEQGNELANKSEAKVNGTLKTCLLNWVRGNRIIHSMWVTEVIKYGLVVPISHFACITHWH